MKKLNLIAASVAALAAGMANAGSISATPNTFAVENFGGDNTSGAQAAIKVQPGALAYNFSTITAVNAGASVYFTVRLSGGLFNGTPSTSAFVFGGSTNNTISVLGVSSDKTTALVQAQASTSGNGLTLGLGAFTFAPGTATTDVVNSVATALGTVGGQVTATIGVTTTAPSSYEGSDTQATVDGPLASGAVAVSAAAEKSAVSAESSQTTKIDLIQSPAGSKFTSGTGVALGSVTFTDKATNATSGPAFQAKTATASYTLANGGQNLANTAVKVKVTPSVGTFPLTSSLGLVTGTSAAVCATYTGGGTAITTSNATSAITLSGGAAVSGTTIYVCMSAPGVDSNNVQQLMAPLTATLAATVTPGTNTDLIPTATGTGYALVYNGSTYTTNTYFPAAIGTYGYSTYTRVVNTGGVTANVSGSFVNGTTGSTGTAAVIVSNLAPGAAVLLNNADVEAAIGVSPALNDRPRLKVTAPTNGLVVQNYVQSPNGTFTEVSAQQAQN